MPKIGEIRRGFDSRYKQLLEQQVLDELSRRSELLDKQRDELLSTSSNQEYWEKRSDGVTVEVNMFVYPCPPSIVYPCWRANLPDVSGVYFIYDEVLRCKYIGQSTNIRRRIRSHNVCNKAIDSVSYLPFKEEELEFAEAYYIGLLRPYCNFNMVERSKSIRRLELI